MEEWNQTTVKEFLLMGLTSSHKHDLYLFPFILLIYLIVLTGNLFIIVLIIADYQLHIPMYYFITNFSFLEIMIATIVVPKTLSTLLSQDRSISFAGCLSQSYLYFLIGTVELLLLAVMSLDRYVAICSPLRYMTIMTQRMCFYLIFACWIGGVLSTSIPTVLKVRLPFCGPNRINHFFCDAGPLLKLSCADTTLIELIDFILFSLVTLTSFMMTLVSYAYIIGTILQIKTVTGRQKAFSTCVSHITIIALGYGSTIFIYVTPKQDNSLKYNKMVSVLTIFVTPVLSPFIFSLRNAKVKQSFRHIMLERKEMTSTQSRT
ncbi:olfactory receptor 6M1-like [Ambystoma mexicanum]|uniref:olfactory receptor 6M1-like n=1 Tax=Ambystoma mexicanum TaxID=8296 RepID=UPI0037E762E4